MTKKALILITIFFLSAFGKLSSQIIIDLAGSKKGTEVIDIDTKNTIKVINMLPDRENNHYYFDIDLIEQEIPPFSKSEFASGDGALCTDTLLKRYKIALGDLLKVDKESNVSNKLDLLKKELEKVDKKYQSCTTDAIETIKATSIIKGLNFEFRNNQTITVTIKRITGKDTIIWTRIYKTPTKSPWSILYGFTFVPNMMNPVANYFSKADTSGKLYTITKRNNDRNDFLKNISPTLMLTWKPLVKYRFNNDCWKALASNNLYQLGFVAGLSLNFASETGAVNVLAGPSIVIADNISLSAGVALVQKNVLKGQYKEGDVVKENLDFDQLHEKRYMAEWFVSLAIRFDQNPFSKKEIKDK